MNLHSSAHPYAVDFDALPDLIYAQMEHEPKPERNRRKVPVFQAEPEESCSICEGPKPHRRRLYCSDMCEKEGRRRAQNGRNRVKRLKMIAALETLPCPICRSPFQPFPSHKKYCSLACGRVAIELRRTTP